MILSRVKLVTKLCRGSVQKMTEIPRTRALSSAPPKPAESVEEDVLFKSHNDKGIITLNRPKALNSLNYSMAVKLLPMLQKWEGEKMFVLIKGAGEKAFCAGGDVRAIVEAGLKGDKKHGQDFFRVEYTMNGLIGTYEKPYVAFIDGIVMGGGVGLSVHGHFRVATERTLFAMPETAIGLFPDVGGSYFLPRLGGKLGYYLALTGHRLKGIDVLKAGIATHYCESGRLGKLEDALLECDSQHDVKHILDRLCPGDDKEFSLAPVLPKINEYFAAKTMEGIVEKLKQDCSGWSRNTLQSLMKMSPTSLKISLRELQLGGTMDLQDCLKMEYRLACASLENKDFYEGIRALLIDKDQTPSWCPKSLEEVTDEMVDCYFKKLPDNTELKNKL